MEERYNRNIGALTEKECALLREKRVFVAGCGGLGGHIIDMLLRVGVGEIIVADGDRFEASNLNRQLLADMTTLGQSKSAAAARYARRINPDVRFSAFDGFVTEGNAAALICGCDAVMDALDNVTSRRVLAEACSDAGIPFIHGAVRGWTAQAAVVMPRSGTLDTLYPEGAQTGAQNAPAFTPALCAAVQTSLCVKLLCERPVDTGRIYLFDLLDLDFETIK